MKIQSLLAIGILSLSFLQADSIVLSKEEEKNWQIKVEKPLLLKSLPLGEFMVQVVTPPTLLHAISLPFEANVKKIFVANYEEVKEGQVLAQVTGKEWIETQQKAISDAIEYKHHQQLTKRKDMLCKEEIIPQKECVAANAELEADKIKVASSKALLKGYGASKEMIEALFKNLTLSNIIPLTSKVEGRIIKLTATPGQSTTPLEAIFVIQEKGDLWIESDMPVEIASGLEEWQAVDISFGQHTFKTSILQLSPVVNVQNQTRHIRFLAPPGSEMLAGMRGTATISLAHSSLKIPKTSLIKVDNRQTVFVKNSTGYSAVRVKVIGEDNNGYFIKEDKAITNIAVTSVAILKNMLGEEDE